MKSQPHVETEDFMPVYLTEAQLLRYGQDSAHAVGKPMGVQYAPQSAQEAREFQPHRWVLEAIQSAFLDGQRFARGEQSVRMVQYGIVPPAEGSAALKS